MALHMLTTEQLRKLVDAMGGGSDWPKLTDDPRVNYAVDCVVSGGELPYDEDIYANEIRKLRPSQHN